MLKDCFLTAFSVLLFGLTHALGQISYDDISVAAGVDSTGTARGVSLVDYDNDGDQDLYFSFSLNSSNILFRNNGDLTFTDVSLESGLGLSGFGNCSTWADFDNDGFTDVYIGFLGDPNLLYRNNGDGTFEDVTEAMGVQDELNTRSVLWADFNKDGWLDLYVHNINAENKHFVSLQGEGFENVIESTGTLDTQVAQGAVAFDYNNDGDLDLYLVHDANQNNRLYDNDGTGNTFTNVAASLELDFAANGMGVDFADINNDGFFDLYVTNLGDNGLFVYDVENGDYTFETWNAGAEGNGMSWGTLFVDADNDGFEDIYVANDSFFSPLPNFFYQNNGDLTFTSILTDDPICGFNASWGAATGDLNHDGLQDLVVATANTVGQQIFLNTTENAGNWIGFDLEGVVSNRSAIGTRVTVYTQDMQRMDEITSSSGFAAQNSLWLSIGIGNQTAIDSVEVRWPTGEIETAYNPPLNTYHHWLEGNVYSPPVDPYDTLEDGQMGSGADDDEKTDPVPVGLVEILEREVQVGPNPNGGSFVINGTLPGDMALVYASNGRCVAQFPLQGMRTEVALSHLTSGVYVLEIHRGSAVVRKRVLVY